jgi:large subunit ribosomal protein L18
MKNKQEKRIRLKKKIRTKIFGTSSCPRLSVFRSNSHIYAQIIDDKKGITIVSCSDLSSKKDTKIEKGTKTEKAKNVGTEVAKKAMAKGIKSCVFDRNGFKYTGRIRALADSARTAGLKF